MLELANVLSNQLSVQTGTIVGFQPNGLILVEAASSEGPLEAHFLRASNAEPPRLEIGDTVLLAVNADEASGYVLGAVEPYSPAGEAPSDQFGTNSGGDGESKRGDEVEITLPRNGSDAMRLSGRKIYIEAGDEIRLTCGGGTVLIDKRGKIVLRGTEIVSRARGSNKIKGASVAIN